MNMQYGGLAVIQRRKTTVDRNGKLAGLRDALAMRAECLDRKSVV